MASDSGGGGNVHASTPPHVSVPGIHTGADDGHSQRGTHIVEHAGARSAHVLLHPDPHSAYSIPPGHEWFWAAEKKGTASNNPMHNFVASVATTS